MHMHLRHLSEESSEELFSFCLRLASEGSVATENTRNGDLPRRVSLLLLVAWAGRAILALALLFPVVVAA